MTALHTVFSSIPSASAVECAIQAFKALPLADNNKLVGIFVPPPIYGVGFELGEVEFVAAQFEAAEQEKMAVENAFRTTCQKAGVAYEWRDSKTAGELIFSRPGALAKAADIVIYPTRSEEASLTRHQIEDVVFTSGRPVLAVPAGWAGEALGNNVVVAWDGGREAARAVFDALPFLLNARTVRIVSVEGISSDPIRQFTPGDDIATTLSRHHVRAETKVVHTVRHTVKQELQTQMLDTGADMLVMGCYGHSRFREMILGGVTRDMLQDVPFPLLLSN